MNHLQTERRAMQRAEQLHSRDARLDRSSAPPESGLTTSEVDAIARMHPGPIERFHQPPFAIPEVIPCQDCGGNGIERGGLTREGEVCRSCKGTKEETILRNYLAESLRIAAGQLEAPVTKRHLAAIVAYARDVVTAAGKKVA